MVHSNSFVVRIWSTEEGRVYGRIEHVGSHDQALFTDPVEIVGFIRSHLLPSAPFTPTNDRRGPAQEPAGNAENG